MKITEAKVQAAVKRCMKQLMKKQYELNLPKSAVDDAIRHLRVYTRKNGTSRAGQCAIMINTSCWQFGNKSWSEYSSFVNDPVIGRIDVTDDEDILLCLVAHEISHYVQYTFRNWFPEYLKKDYRKPHGPTFQKLYRYLRRDMVNPMIESKMMENAA